jgi:hypothetical protein
VHPLSSGNLTPAEFESHGLAQQFREGAVQWGTPNALKCRRHCTKDIRDPRVPEAKRRHGAMALELA